MKSRMTRERHVRICEGLGVKFPGATRPGITRRKAHNHCIDAAVIGDLPYKAKAVYLCAAAAERYRSTLLLSTKVVPVSINTG